MCARLGICPCTACSVPAWRENCVRALFLEHLLNYLTRGQKPKKPEKRNYQNSQGIRDPLCTEMHRFGHVRAHPAIRDLAKTRVFGCFRDPPKPPKSVKTRIWGSGPNPGNDEIRGFHPKLEFTETRKPPCLDPILGISIPTQVPPTPRHAPDLPPPPTPRPLPRHHPQSPPTQPDGQRYKNQVIHV